MPDTALRPYVDADGRWEPIPEDDRARWDRDLDSLVVEGQPVTSTRTHYLADPDALPHVTSYSLGEFARAGMLRQVALVAEFGEDASRYALGRCAGCDARVGRDGYAEVLEWRVTHEREHRAP